MMTLSEIKRRERMIVVFCLLLVGGMAGLAWGAVPLYDLFCRVTGYGGTTGTAQAGPTQVLDRTMTIRFDGNVAGNMGWGFDPLEKQMKINIGEVEQTHYQAVNGTNKATSGSAVFNVTPHETGVYFKKIECFCFREQHLAAGESAEMPVIFYIDPALDDDPTMNDVHTITLSYTFFQISQ
ncbi:MAG: cytochrome c oxidase assembly protein [Parvularculales bacterium]